MLITDREMSVHLIKNELVDTELIFWREVAADLLHRSARLCSSVKKAHLLPEGNWSGCIFLCIGP